MRKCYRHMNLEGEYAEMVTLKRARHYEQCDIPAIIPSLLANFFAGRKRDVIPFDKGIQVQRSLVTDFLWKYYADKDQSNKPLSLLGDDYSLSDSFMVGSNIVFEDVEPSKL